MRSSSRSILGLSGPARRVAREGLLAADRRRELALDLRPDLRPLALRERVEQPLRRSGVEVLVEIAVVDLDDRRVDAGAEALDLGHREHAVRRRPADVDPELLLAGGDDLVRAA